MCFAYILLIVNYTLLNDIFVMIYPFSRIIFSQHDANGVYPAEACPLFHGAINSGGETNLF